MKALNVMDKGFRCWHCQAWVSNLNLIGSKNRNHCPRCLCSLHIDDKAPGDRKSHCLGMMMPIALTFKKEGFDKKGIAKQGELMIVHKCLKCDKVSINRVAGDDDVNKIFKLFEKQLSLDKKDKLLLLKNNVVSLTQDNEAEIKSQLYGK
jgi:hypothetical protein